MNSNYNNVNQIHLDLTTRYPALRQKKFARTNLFTNLPTLISYNGTHIQYSKIGANNVKWFSNSSDRRNGFIW